MENNKIKKKMTLKKHKITALMALLLCLVLCFASCTTTKKASDAQGELENGLKWEYSASDNTLEIKGEGAVPSYKSSSELPWIDAVKSIEKIEIDDAITSIGSYAFYGCSALEEVEMPESVTEIGNFAFAYCSALEEIELPDTLAKVGDSAFEACSSLTSVTLGASIISLGSRAFAFCPSLESVHILGDVEIKSETFYNCNALDVAVFHAGITEDKVADDAFKNTEFKYSKAQIAVDPNTTVNVTIEYVYEDNTTAAESVKFEGLKIGEGYTKNSPEIDGYTADKLTVSGNAPVSDTTIKVTYKKNAETTDAETTAPVTDANIADDGDGGGNIIFLVIMVVLIVGIGVAAFLLTRSNKQNEEKAKNQNKAKNRKQK